MHFLLITSYELITYVELFSRLVLLSCRCIQRLSPTERNILVLGVHDDIGKDMLQDRPLHLT